MPANSLTSVLHLGVRIVRVAVGEHRAAAGERRQRADVAARRMAEQADAVVGDAHVLGVGAHELDGGQHILHGVREGLMAGLGQPVADREHRDAARGQPRPPVLKHAARALHPAAAMDADQDGKRPGPFGR